MRILLLGGTGEAAELARALHAGGVHVTYSLAGRARPPRLPCPVRYGGFGGVAGLQAYLARTGIELLVDATHPFAAGIQANAAAAAKAADIPRWAYQRPSWLPGAGDDWRYAADLATVQQQLAPFQRPLLTLGETVRPLLARIPPHQHWLVRTLPGSDLTAGPQWTVTRQQGPFREHNERELLAGHRVDVLVSKDSGGDAVAPKLTAARDLGLPVILLQRPSAPAAERVFTDAQSLVEALAADGARKP